MYVVSRVGLGLTATIEFLRELDPNPNPNPNSSPSIPNQTFSAKWNLASAVTVRLLLTRFGFLIKTASKSR